MDPENIKIAISDDKGHEVLFKIAVQDEQMSLEITPNEGASLSEKNTVNYFSLHIYNALKKM